MSQHAISTSRRFSRRQFLRSTTLAGIAAPLILKSGLRAASPNGKLAHACIGVHGIGAHDMANFLSHPQVEIAAICDVDSGYLEKAKALVPNARVYSDWRELIEKEHNKIDSVNVSVPDHMHFPIAYTAIQAGKHVYCQKPLCHDVAEVRALTKAAIKRKVVTQLGTQIASTVTERSAVAMLKAGAIGKIKHVYLCSNRPGAIDAYRLVGPRPAVTQEPPQTLNWDLWIGCAPWRPYATDIYHPVKWRAWQDFGTGWSGDIGCHIFDATWKGLGLKAPLTVEAEVQESWQKNSARRVDTWPQGDHITWTFPANDMIAGKELVLEWFDGAFYPPVEIRSLYKGEYPGEAAMLIGTEGALLIPHCGTPVLLPEEKFKDYQRKTFPERNHYHHYVDACRGGEMTESHFAQTGPMTEAILLGTIAIRTPGEKLAWNSRSLSFDANRHADTFLRREYRKGWAVTKV